MIHHYKNNKGRLGILAHQEASFEPSPAFVLLTGVRKRLLPLTKREGCDSVISSDFKSKISITNENNLFCKDLSYFGRSALLCRQGQELSVLVSQYLSNFSDTVFSRFTSHFSHKRTAFTLAEVLITLGIIGVISALTIPGLIGSYQKNITVEKLKEMYSLINQAANLYTSETGTEFGSFDTQLTGQEFLDRYFSSYIKVVKKCTIGKNCYQNSTLPLQIDKKTSAAIPEYIVGLANGSYIGMFRNVAGAIFYVDINGANKPNLSGHDIFYFYLINSNVILYDNNNDCNIELKKMATSLKSGLYPGTYDACYVPQVLKTREELLGTVVHRSCNKNTTNLSYGDACAAVIMKDGWKISKDYPW